MWLPVHTWRVSGAFVSYYCKNTWKTWKEKGLVHFLTLELSNLCFLILVLLNMIYHLLDLLLQHQ